MSSSGAYGWSAVPRDLSEFTKSANSANTAAINANTISLPDDELSIKALSFARSKLPTPTVNHSLRVYCYGHTILAQHFPDLLALHGFGRTYFLTCMLHDIGTADEFFRGTKMSFDFYGALVALKELEGWGAEKDESEAVAEAIIRHQDLGTSGEISALGAIIQVATIFDNVGMFPELVHKATIESVTAKYPRLKWSGCFASTLREEIKAKPWCHSTHMEGAAEKVEENELMAPYE